MPGMDVDEARRRFGEARVARLATADAEGRPHLVPVVFALDGDEIVTAVDRKPKKSVHLRRLRNIEANPAVSLLVDRYDEEWDLLWWIRADGHARIVPPDQPGHTEAVARLQRKYPQYHHQPPDGPVIAITVQRWQAWTATLDSE